MLYNARIEDHNQPGSHIHQMLWSCVYHYTRVFVANVCKYLGTQRFEVHTAYASGHQWILLVVHFFIRMSNVRDPDTFHFWQRTCTHWRLLAYPEVVFHSSRTLSREEKYHNYILEWYIPKHRKINFYSLKYYIFKNYCIVPIAFSEFESKFYPGFKISLKALTITPSPSDRFILLPSL